MGTVKVFLNKPNKLFNKSSNKLIHYLTDNELTRYNQLKRWQDKTNYLYSHILVRMALVNYTNLPLLEFKFVFKPNKNLNIIRISKNFCININITHTTELVACAISNDYKVGIDIEKYNNKNYAEVYPYCLTPKEQEMIIFQNKEDMFLKIWTMKEAFLKGHGIGLGISPLELDCDLKTNTISSENPLLNDYCSWKFKFIETYPQYICSLAIKKENNMPVNIEVNEVSSDNLLGFFI